MYGIADHIDKYAPVEGKSALVIGSQVPWVEAILLAKGAAKVTTFDYIKITSEHPQVNYWVFGVVKENTAWNASISHLKFHNQRSFF